MTRSVGRIIGWLGLVLCLACSRSDPPMQQVKTGIDVLAGGQFYPFQGKRIGLITNHTGVNRQWRSSIDILHETEEVQLVALFSPEHGIRGVRDTNVPSSVDVATGLPIHSLYGETRRPTAAMLEGIDVLMFDIQDIGARFYTYIGTMKNCMEAAAEHGIQFAVLDRPNPITGVHVEGPVLAKKHVFELAGIHSIPIRHGMTVAELAKMFRDQDSIDVKLTVMLMSGWRRDMWHDETGLPWINPSPNMRNLYEAILYPGLGLLERTNVANKRGLERPFEMFGAPWVDGIELAAELNRRQIPGITFTPIRFTPTDHKYPEEPSAGVAVNLTDRDLFPSVVSGLHVLQALYTLYPDHFDIDKIWHVTRSQKLIDQLKDGTPISSIVSSYEDEFQRFLRAREQYLLYD